MTDLYHYLTPPISSDGSCRVGGSPVLYELSNLIPITEENTVLLKNLNAIVEKLQQETRVDWVGIYKKIQKSDGQWILLKLAYRGAISRAEFPLTENFAKNSNNSTVGLTGNPVLIQDVRVHQGPYYQCDGKVLSEFCCPIKNPSDEVIGIIDAESFQANYFAQSRLFEIEKVCFELRSLL